MTNLENLQTVYPPAVRLFEHIYKTRQGDTFYLNLEPKPEIGKFRFWGGEKRAGGRRQIAEMYLDIDAFRVYAFDILCWRSGFTTGRIFAGSQKGTGVVSRVAQININGDRLFFSIENGPGKVMPTGAIQLAGTPTSKINIAFPKETARQMAAIVQGFVQALDVQRLYSHKALMRGLPPYPTGPAGVREVVVEAPLAGDISKKATTAPTVIPSETREILFYKDGTRVNGDNSTEVATFKQYMAERGSQPENVEMLRTYCIQS